MPDITRVPNITIAAQPPTAPAPLSGDQWWSTVTGVFYIFYDDGTTSQWVMGNPIRYGIGPIAATQIVVVNVPGGLPALTVKNVDAAVDQQIWDFNVFSDGHAGIVARKDDESPVAEFGFFRDGSVLLSGIRVSAGIGAPIHAAPQGSVYSRKDGSSSTSRLYVNIDGLSGWTYVVTGG